MPQLSQNGPWGMRVQLRNSGALLADGSRLMLYELRSLLLITDKPKGHGSHIRTVAAEILYSLL